MILCHKCKYAMFDYEEYYNTKSKQSFVYDCKKNNDIENSEECEDFIEEQYE